MKQNRRKGEGYVDTCVGLIAFVMFLVVAINIFDFINIRIELDRVAENLIEAATYEGCFGDTYDEAVSAMEDEYGSFEETHGADAYFNTAYERVQLGERMWVTVTVKTDVKGVGVFHIPVTLQVKKSGLSEKYWK